ncbi:MAG: 23S rRNA (pseudouridine(1915)-N(3))-methyltransferase RlmH [Pseudomonadota bacterium]
MKLVVLAVGRLKSGPEADLVERYAGRAAPLARRLGMSGPDLVEVEAKSKDPARRRDDEALKLAAAAPTGAKRVVLDERGDSLRTDDFASYLDRWAGSGAPATAFFIGGADGHGAQIVKDADLALSFGRAVWPHMLVRAMLAEQIYRALSILAGHPYHRS